MTVSDLVRSQFPDASDAFCASYAVTIRNQLLASSDWTQLPDAPSDRQAWAQYRQVLRDLPSSSNWPDVELPERPDA